MYHGTSASDVGRPGGNVMSLSGSTATASANSGLFSSYSHPKKAPSTVALCARPKRMLHSVQHYDAVTNPEPIPAHQLPDAVASARPGDHIVVEAGVCRRPISIATEDIVIRPADPKPYPSLRIEIDDPHGEGGSGGACVTVMKRCFIQGFTLVHHQGVALRVMGGDPDVTNCSLTGAKGGVVILSRAYPLFRECSFCDSNHATGLRFAERSMGIVELCDFKNNGGGVSVPEGANPWFYRCLVEANQNFGVSFDNNAKGVVSMCDFVNNGTQGVYVGPGASPTVWKCNFREGQASGVKVYGNAHVEESAFTGNRDHDIDVQAGGNVTAIRNRFLGGSCQGVVVWQRGKGTFKHNSFDQYTLWAFAAHQSARVDLVENFFTTSVDFDTEEILDTDAGGSGLSLQGVAGMASGNCFVGWRQGYVRARVAFKIEKSYHFKQQDEEPLIDQVKLQQESPALEAEIYAIARQDPSQTRTVDLSAPTLQAKNAKLPKQQTQARKVHIDPATLDLIEPVLKADATARHLDLSNNTHLGDRGAQAVAHIISDHPSLKSVALSDTGMTDSGLVALCQAAATAPELREIEVQSNRGVTQQSMPQVKQLLRDNRRIHRFDVRSQDQQQHTRLQPSELDDINFLCAVNESASDRDRQHLLGVYDNDPRVTALALKQQPFGLRTVDEDKLDEETGALQVQEQSWASPDAMVQIMCYSLRRNTMLTELHIDANALTSEALAPLMGVLRDSHCAPQLQSLSLSRNDVADISGVCDALIEGGRNRSLRAIDLTENTLTGKRNARALRQLIDAGASGEQTQQQQPVLNFLNVAANYFDPSDIDFIVLNLPEGVRVRSEGQKPPADAGLQRAASEPLANRQSSWELQQEKRPASPQVVAGPTYGKNRTSQVHPVRTGGLQQQQIKKAQMGNVPQSPQ